MLKLENVTVCYGPVTALRDVSIEVQEGELVTLIGANGAGKTTTLKAISGMLPLTSGTISFGGREIGGATPRQILALGIAHCPEGRRVFPFLTVRENLEMGAFLRRDYEAVKTDMERIFLKLPRLRERDGGRRRPLRGLPRQPPAPGAEGISKATPVRTRKAW